eukprot:Skav218669  [mRNA]  locus=scaffold5113:71009:71620:+ [translate_table: standard]
MQQVFTERAEDCALQLSQLVDWEIHPGDKPESLQRLSSRLSLGLDSFVFLDDNFFEVQDVCRTCPEVLVIHVPADDDAFEQLLRHHWVLEAVPANATKEDQQRTELYRQNAARRAERDRHPDLRQFLDALQVEVVIRQPSLEDKVRLSQLCARTNQFNTTQLRLSESDVEDWLRSCEKRHVLAAEVKDKFGDYGCWVLVLYFF